MIRKALQKHRELIAYLFFGIFCRSDIKSFIDLHRISAYKFTVSDPAYLQCQRTLSACRGADNGQNFRFFLHRYAPFAQNSDREGRDKTAFFTVWAISVAKNTK